jgi:hypothetical protein
VAEKIPCYASVWLPLLLAYRNPDYRAQVRSAADATPCGSIVGTGCNSVA